jgi:hypothetical protein
MLAGGRSHAQPPATAPYAKQKSSTPPRETLSHSPPVDVVPQHGWSRLQPNTITTSRYFDQPADAVSFH